MSKDMDKPGFTPGPWNSSTRIEEPSRGHRVSYVGADSAAGIIAQVWKPAGGDDAETIANARLIAAAPDLYAACEAMLEVLDHNAKMGCGISPASTLARAALAKAGGAK